MDRYRFMRVAELANSQKRQLECIEPSFNGTTHFYPCLVRLRNGSVHENCLIVDDRESFQKWRQSFQKSAFNPSSEAFKQDVKIDDVIEILDSSNRLPKRFADQIYKVGESGMGYFCFTVRFITGLSYVYYTGSIVDFIEYPKGMTTMEVVSVGPASQVKTYLRDVPYVWCRFSSINEK